ncbi:MAG: hypothetical protein RLO02_06275, partial [Roseitalea porphyridii]
EADDVAAVLAQVYAEDHNAHGPFLPFLNTSILHRGRREGRAIHKGGEDHAIGRSRGGLSTKIHAVVDQDGLPVKLLITPGQASDKTAAPV